MVVTGGRNWRRHGDGRRWQRPSCQIVREAFFNCSTMRFWEIRMNEERPYLQMWRGVWVPFCKIAIVCFLSIRYRSHGPYCRIAATPSSPTRVFIRKNRDVGEIINYSQVKKCS